ncbi:DUF1389 domain-containing protein [Chlamydia vaughanii]|uniref:DUF1389 domain-containing protein n=1 Tax=Chlamydia vaughanii TaxID=3112552 RepID=UPI0032B13E7D
MNSTPALGMPSQVIQKDNRDIAKISCFQKNALKITTAVLAVIALALIIVVACGITHPAIIAALALSVVLAIVMTALFLSEITYKIDQSLPMGFLNKLKNVFPEVLYDLCIVEKVTLQELRSILTALSTKNFDALSSECRQKVERFGIKKLQLGFEGIDCSSGYLNQQLEHTLVTNCPLYFMSKFVELGSPDSVKRGLSPQLYWFSCLGGMSSRSTTVLHPCIGFFARTIKHQEFTKLLKNLEKGLWQKVEHLLKNIQSRMIASLDQEDITALPQKKIDLSIGLARSGGTIMLLCHHGINWDQVKLLKQAPLPMLGVLLDCIEKGMRADLLFNSVSHVVVEGTDFDSCIALVTTEELQAAFKSSKDMSNLQLQLNTLSKLSRNTGLVLTVKN